MQVHYGTIELGPHNGCAAEKKNTEGPSGHGLSEAQSVCGCAWVQMFARKTWGSGDRKDQMSLCWICAMPICRSTSTNCSGQIDGQRYCFTCFGFRFNVTLLIIWSIVNAVVTQDKTIQRAISSCIDYIFINESIYTVACVWVHLQQFGLTSKNQEHLENGTCVLGLCVQEELGKLLVRAFSTCVGSWLDIWQYMAGSASQLHL